MPSYDRTEEVLDVVRDFLLFFYASVQREDVQTIGGIYENTWGRLTHDYFEKSDWPPPEVVEPLVDDDAVFMTLYKELYFRHIYARRNPSLDERIESYKNYCNLFNFILNSDSPVALQLPNTWLWDIVDEFIYQFQSFCQYRAKAVEGKAAEAVELQNPINAHVWNVHSVLNILHSLAEKSNINAQLTAWNNGDENVDEVAGPFGSHSLYKNLGYFGLIGMCRLHCLLGDYYQALMVLNHVELNKKFFTSVPACQITTFYYVAFSYLMLTRYQDCVRTLVSILGYVQKTKQLNNRAYQFDVVSKKTEQMYAMLAMAITLHPQRLDDSIHATLKEHHTDTMLKMNMGDEEAYLETFTHCCPKFVSPICPPVDTAAAGNALDAQQRQVNLFMGEVKGQILLPSLRSYLKLYTTISISKLASFMEGDEVKLRIILLMYKHKARSLVWSSGPPLSGTLQTTSEVNFYLDDDIIHITDSKVEVNHGQYFLRQIANLSAFNQAMQHSLA